MAWGSVAAGLFLLLLLLVTLWRGIARWVTDPLRQIDQDMAAMVEPGEAAIPDPAPAPAEIHSLSRRMAVVRRQMQDQAGQRELRSFRLGRSPFLKNLPGLGQGCASRATITRGSSRLSSSAPRL